MSPSGQESSRAAAFRAEHEGAGVELPYAGIKTFLKTEATTVEAVDGRDAAVLGVPYDGAVSNRTGARHGPDAIRTASAWLAYLSAYKGGLTNMWTGRQVDFSALELADCGDVPVFPMDRATTAESVAAHVATVAAQGAMPVLLGGDHSCTLPAFRGYAEGREHDSVGVVQVDAHTDTVAESTVFGEYFHGSSTHHIADSPYADYDAVSQVGIRGYEAPEFFEFADDVGLSLYTAREIEERGIRAVMRDAIAAASDGTDAVYVTFDIDAVDPGIAPGTGTPEPGGLTAREAMAAVETIGAADAVGAIDLMEVAPEHDPAGNTARLAAYLLVTMLERQFAE